MLHHSQFALTDSPLRPIRQPPATPDEWGFSFWGNHNTVLEVNVFNITSKSFPADEDKRYRPVFMQRREEIQTAVHRRTKTCGNVPSRHFILLYHFQVHTAGRATASQSLNHPN